MAIAPAGYTAGAPANGVIPLYDATGAIAGTIADGKTNLLDSNSTQAEKSAAYAFPSEIGVSGGAAAGTGQAAPFAPASTTSSYLTGASPSTQSNSMATSPPPSGTPTAQQAIQYYVSQGGDPSVTPAMAMYYYNAMQAATPAGADQNAFGIKTVGSGPGYTTLQSTSGQQISVDNAGNYFSIDPSTGNHTPVSDVQAQQMGFQSSNPESAALKQMGQIDPTTEALRSSLGQSYADSLSKASTPPSAADYQSYLNTFKAVDPSEYAARAGLGTSMDSYLKSMQDQFALGSQLDPTTAKQVEQQTRLAQAGRGNVYGTPQMVEEAMSTGQAGQALQQQRTQNLAAALGGQQSYLGAGLGLGDTAMSLYQQGLSNKANAQQNALSYLSSGQTPYQAGAGYLNQANANAANAAQGGPVYQPASLGQGNLGTAQQAPQYGLDVGSQAQNYFNSLNNAYGTGAAGTKNRAVGAGVGAASGAVSGAAAGAPLAGATYGMSIPIGAGIGALAGGASGYYS